MDRTGSLQRSHAGAGVSAAAPAALVVTHREYDHVFGIYVPIAIGVFALVLALVVGAVAVFARRPPERAARWHEHNLIEGAYALLLAGVVVFLLIVTYRAEHRVDNANASERPSLTVEVIGAKWEWHFHYPAYGIDRYSGVSGDETLVVPAGEAIRFELVSEDVIHEFWVPELRFKHDLIPGSTQQMTATFAHPGTYPGQCGEFCGLYHARMVFTVQALSPAAFAAWASAASRSAAVGGAA